MFRHQHSKQPRWMFREPWSLSSPRTCQCSGTSWLPVFREDMYLNINMHMSWQIFVWANIQYYTLYPGALELVCIVHQAILCTHLWQLLCNVSSHKYSLQVDPEVLHNQPVLEDLCRIGQVFYPLLNVWLERSIVPVDRKIINS